MASSFKGCWPAKSLVLYLPFDQKEHGFMVMLSNSSFGSALTVEGYVGLLLMVNTFHSGDHCVLDKYQQSII